MGAPSDILDRVDELLQDLDSGAKRRVAVPLIKMSDAASDETDGTAPSGAANRDAVHYLLLTAGDPGTFKDVISGDRRIKEMRIGIALTILAAGESAVDPVKTQARTRLLAETWDDVVDVLQDPNNHMRVVTGWIGAQQFTATAPRQDKDRLTMIASFVARYYREMGAL